MRNLQQTFYTAKNHYAISRFCLFMANNKNLKGFHL